MSEYSYLDPTYPAYYWYFNRPKTILWFSLRRFLLLLTTYDIICSSITISFNLINLLMDKFNSFQSNSFIQTLIYLPIGIFFNDRILFRSFWTMNSVSESFYLIIWLHIILNSILLLCSINMIIAIKYFKPCQALIYFIFKFSYFINITTILVEWIINREEHVNTMTMLYGNGNFGFFTPNINIMCLALMEWFWKIFTLTIIFRSIQYLRDYCLHKELNLKYEDPSSDQLIIHIIPNESMINKQYNI